MLRQQAQMGGQAQPDAAPAAIAPAMTPPSPAAAAQMTSAAPQPLPPGMAPADPNAPMAAKPVRTDAQKAARQFAQREGRQGYAGAVTARAITALTTDTPFVERLVYFWSNHFAVSADKLAVIGLSGTLEFEAIRPHVLGNFRDMLTAVERHPAMLIYLDQAVSIGPDSPLGQRIAMRGKRKVGLNENLAREILELHTLGVRSGYTQADVTEFARAMTGWTVAGSGRGRAHARRGPTASPASSCSPRRSTSRAIATSWASAMRRTASRRRRRC